LSFRAGVKEWQDSRLSRGASDSEGYRDDGLRRSLQSGADDRREAKRFWD